MTPQIYLKIQKSPPKYVGGIIWESDFANHPFNCYGPTSLAKPSLFFARTKFLTIPKENLELMLIHLT